MKNEACALAALAAIPLFNPTQAVAQQWPDKPVRILVPFSPGCGTDIHLSALLKKEIEKYAKAIKIANIPVE